MTASRAGRTVAWVESLPGLEPLRMTSVPGWAFQTLGHDAQARLSVKAVLGANASVNSVDKYEPLDDAVRIGEVVSEEATGTLYRGRAYAPRLVGFTIRWSIRGYAFEMYIEGRQDEFDAEDARAAWRRVRYAVPG